jgi:hypothetical protein
MASLKDAEQARTESADLLRDLGAHAISVEPDVEEVPAEPAAPTANPPSKPTASPTATTASSTKANSGKTKPASRRRTKWSVVAWFDGDPPDAVPSEVHVAHRRGSAAVPVKVRRSEQFQPETTLVSGSASGPTSVGGSGPEPTSAKPESDVFRPE